MIRADRVTEVLFEPSGKSVPVAPGSNVFELAKMCEVNIPSACGGKGNCGKCKVLIAEGRQALGSYSSAELKYLSLEEREKGYRLACAISVPDVSHFIIRVPREVEVGMPRLQVEGIEVPVVLDPVVKKYVTRLSAATLEDSRSAEDRLLDALQEEYGLAHLVLSYEGAQELPSAIEKGAGVVTSVIWEQCQIIAIEPGNTRSRCFGLAVDIGTTKIACFLIDLNSGRLEAASSCLNPQIPYGEEVISRITFTMKSPQNLAILQRRVIEGINRALEESCSQAEVSPEEIYECCFVGNTCMIHLFLGISPKSLGLSPYYPVIRKGLSLEVQKLPSSLRIHPHARLYILPAIAGFVGADNVGVQLAMDSSKSGRMRLILDIGTNTEIVLEDENSSLVCSCASGPAFEGMQVKHGGKAEAGSIEKVIVDPKTLEVTFQTIGRAKPVTICGSGVIAALAQFLKVGIINQNGRMNAELAERTPRMRRGSQGWEFVLAWQEETAIDTDIVITQDDISEIQKAKAAIHSGCMLLMKKRGITEEDIGELVMAGAFGQYVDPRGARIIGMYPEIRLNRIRIVGNAAGVGARMALVSKEARQKAEYIAKKAGYYELATDPEFATEYVNSMFFPYVNLDKFPKTKKLLQRGRKRKQHE